MSSYRRPPHRLRPTHLTLVDEASRRAPVDLAVAALRPPQRRVLRLLLTGASLPLVAQAADIHLRDVLLWLSDDFTFRPAIEAVQRDLTPASRSRLRALIALELKSNDVPGLDATAHATLAVLRAIGRLDAETDLLHRSALRTERWKAGGT